ncbi:hypothetical protein, partial [Enterobacter intestinihominis]
RHRAQKNRLSAGFFITTTSELVGHAERNEIIAAYAQFIIFKELVAVSYTKLRAHHTFKVIS